jgi:hypothetical protein
MSKIEVDAIDKQSGSTLTLGGSGTAVTLAAGATQTGFGRTGTVDWQTTPKTATFTAVSGEGYFANTTGSAFNMNLPAGSAGAIVSVADYAGTWQTNNLTVVPNGTDKIGGVNSNVDLDTEGQSVTFIFVDSTQGWINTMDSTSNVRANAFIVATGGTITTSGDCKIHTFTGPGTFTVTATSPVAANNEVSYLAVAGGGGANGEYGGGGGAGGFRETKSPVTPYTASPLDGQPSAPNRITVTATAFPIAVGAGGGAPPTNNARGVSGANSTFSTIVATGGGGGGSGGSPGPISDGPGLPGGSGGGAGGYGPGTRTGGTGNTPPVSPSQGFPGGPATSVGGGYNSAGGGGAGNPAGSVNSPPSPGAVAGPPGGVGVSTSISASPTFYAGGGGGGTWDSPSTPPSGGNGGGGRGSVNGSNPLPAADHNGTVNTGGGAGGGGNTTGGYTGGSGIVIIRYKFK